MTNEEAYWQGVMDKFAEKGIEPTTSFLSKAERDRQDARLDNKGLNAGKGLRSGDTNKSTGVDKSIGIKYSKDSTKVAGILETVGKYTVPLAERLKRMMLRIKGAPEDGADLLGSIKGTPVGATPEVDAIYRGLGKKTTAVAGAGAGALGLNSLLNNTQLQDTEADA